MLYDIIIIGGGPAGLTAAIYALRAGKSVLIIEKNTFGDTKTHEECEQIFGAAYLDKRYCKPYEVADLAAFLASEVSAHMMGSGIRLDAGMDALLDASREHQQGRGKHGRQYSE